MTLAPQRHPSGWRGPVQPGSDQWPSSSAGTRQRASHVTSQTDIQTVKAGRAFRYPSSLQDLWPPQALVDEGLRWLMPAASTASADLHLWVDGVQVPAERLALQPLSQRHPLANVAKGSPPQLWPQ